MAAEADVEGLGVMAQEDLRLLTRGDAGLLVVVEPVDARGGLPCGVVRD